MRVLTRRQMTSNKNVPEHTEIIWLQQFFLHRTHQLPFPLINENADWSMTMVSFASITFIFPEAILQQCLLLLFYPVKISLFFLKSKFSVFKYSQNIFFSFYFHVKEFFSFSKYFHSTNMYGTHRNAREYAEEESKYKGK